MIIEKAVVVFFAGGLAWSMMLGAQGPHLPCMGNSSLHVCKVTCRSEAREADWRHRTSIHAVRKGTRYSVWWHRLRHFFQHGAPCFEWMQHLFANQVGCVSPRKIHPWWSHRWPKWGQGSVGPISTVCLELLACWPAVWALFWKGVQPPSCLWF